MTESAECGRYLYECRGDLPTRIKYFMNIIVSKFNGCFRRRTNCYLLDSIEIKQKFIDGLRLFLEYIIHDLTMEEINIFIEHVISL